MIYALCINHFDCRSTLDSRRYLTALDANTDVRSCDFARGNNWEILALDVSACPGENRKLLVLLNPKSGSGRGRETFQRRVHPILSEAERPYEIHITKCPNYASEFVRTKDIYQWCGLLMVGGDGIVFEVVNGLFQRPDWERALRELPLGVIPCGSGNGLAKSIAHAKQ